MEKDECGEIEAKVDEILDVVTEPLYIPEEKPLWLPAGSVRAILSLGTIATLLYLLATGKVDVNVFIAVTGVVFGFYFGSKKGS